MPNVSSVNNMHHHVVIIVYECTYIPQWKTIPQIKIKGGLRSPPNPPPPTPPPPTQKHVYKLKDGCPWWGFHLHRIEQWRWSKHGSRTGMVSHQGDLSSGIPLCQKDGWSSNMDLGTLTEVICPYFSVIAAWTCFLCIRCCSLSTNWNHSNPQTEIKLKWHR